MRQPNRFPELILSCLFTALAGASATAQLSAGPSLPSLSGFTPAQGAQGSSVTIIFTGRNFIGKGLGLQFSPAAGLKVGVLQAISSTQISAQVQIDSGAQVGPHGVLLVVADHGLQSNMPFVVTGTQCGMPGTPPCPPALRGFSPLQGTQGSSVTVTFTGANFSGAASAQFTPGAGITVRSTTVVNGNQIQAELAIDANAPLGARAVSLLLGKTRLQAQNTFTIVTGEKPGQPAAMQILRVIPNQVPAGSENMDLTLIGTNFVPGTQVTFTRAGAATDVFVVGASRYVNSTELHVVVNVLPTALAGGRDINLQTPSRQTTIGKGMLNVLAPSSSKQSGPPAIIKITPIALQKFTEGVIELDAPKWGDRWDQGEIESHYGMPMLDDDLVFKWHEQNPGTADYYELRIYARDGKTLLGTKRIDGKTTQVFGHSVTLVPTYFRPDAAFLAALLEKTAKPSLLPILYKSGDFKPPVVNNGKLKSLTTTGPKVSDGDMQWEVAGFRTYNKSGATQKSGSIQQQQQPVQNRANSVESGQTDLEVEISTRWPLGAPQAPTGLNCSGAGTGTGLQVTNVAVSDDNGKQKKGVDPNNYIGDLWVLSGNFNLSRSPYATHPHLHQAPGSQCSNCFVGETDQIQFDDVFLDWGDGTVQRVNAPPKDSGVMNWSRGVEMSLSPDAKINPLQHPYQYPGSYTIRVFQLAEADAQHVDPSLVAASVDGPGIHPFLQAAVLANVSKAGGNLSQGNFKSAFQSITLGKNSVSTSAAISSNTVLTPQGPSPADIAGRAYMIYCHTVYITTREDLDADGPLHLKEIKDPDFPGHDATKFKAISPSLRRSQVSPEAVPQGAAPARLVLASAAQQKEQPQLRPLRPQTATADAICSTCDDAMMASTELHYYGTGRVQITWHIDGTIVQTPLHLNPSERRTNLQRAAPGVKEPPIILTWSKPIDSTALQAKPLGMHEVSVEAEVIPEPSFPNLSIAVQKTLGSIMGPGKEVSAQAGSAEVASSNATAQAKSLLNMLAPPPGSGLSPLKVGLLSPMKQNGSGMGAVQYINAPLATVAAKANELPDQHVASKPRHYQVVEADPNQPCKFKFPVKSGGSFEIGGLQGHITKNGTKYSGTGNLIIHMANAQSGSYDLYPPIPVRIDNWDVPDGETVASGSIDVSPKLQLVASLPALTGTIDRIQGSAGGEVDATLSVALTDDTLRLPGVEKPPSWNGVTAELHATGTGNDWSKDNLTLPTTLIGWSAFQMQSSKVRLDLSHHDGDAASCGLSGADWVGVRFSSLTIIPYTMDLVAASALQPTVSDWGILDSGLCGSTLNTGPFTAALGDGSVSFASITFSASNRSYKAHYKQMDIYVPWLDTHLKGDADLQSGGGKQASITFPFNGGAASKTYSNVAMKATNLQFTKQGNIGWVVQSNTHFTLNAENKPFAAFDAPIYYGMDGRAYFANGAGTLDIHLGGSSHLAQTPLDLNAAHLTAPMNGDKILGIQVDANVHLSEVMPAAEANIDYEIDKSNKNYSARGPSYAPFTIEVPYPAGQPSSEAKVHPQYSGGPNGEYTGKVDVSEIGGPPLTGEFRLGYKGGHDYWLARVSLDLGDEGVPIIPAPPIMNLYTIRGGMGHNFPLSAFKDESSITSISPVFDDSFLFMAGLRVGMPDKFTYTLDGDLVIKATGQNAGTRMDFHSWLLKSDHSGNGDFQGFFQYAGSNFDGRLWGRLDFMNGMAYLDLGNSENNAAIDMHFGNSGPWHIDAGKKEGPRIHGHLLIADADAYFMLSNDGLALGGSESFNLTVGDDSVASAYVRGMVDVGVAITPQPHVAGDFGANVSAGVCVDSICVSDDVGAQVHAEFAPLDVRATASLPLPWPLSDITFTVHI